jgi:ubiquinone biosynthesis protein Coq4
MLISAGMLYAATKEPDIMGRLAVGIGEGYAMGRAAKNLMSPKWEDMWARPLADIQAEYNIMPKTASVAATPETVAA